jgi:glucose/arabinose dehydrogenase
MSRLTAAVMSLALLAACSSSGVSSSSTRTNPVTSVPASDGTASGPTDAATTVAPATTTPLQPDSVNFSTFLSGVTQPVDIVWKPGDAALYVVQQTGTVVPVRDGTLGAPVLDIGDELIDNGEQGLLGFAFHPTKPFAYADYIDHQGNTVIAEFPVAADGSIERTKERLVLGIPQPYPNHNGGKLLFDDKGLLYIAMGDGGAAGDPERRGQNLAELLGKILRIDPLAAGSAAYTIPADNPFVNTAGARGEVYSYGVRNPWRFAFDRANGDLWIADVGQNLWEEVDHVAAADGAGKGANFGWSAFEGSHPFNADQRADGAIAPVWEYAHGDDGCSISGGQVYRGTAMPSLAGWFVTSDYCSGKVWAVHPDGTVVQLGKVASVSAVADGPDGTIYLLEYAAGTILRLDPK